MQKKIHTWRYLLSRAIDDFLNSLYASRQSSRDVFDIAILRFII